MEALPADLQAVKDRFDSMYKRTYTKTTKMAAAANVLLDQSEDAVYTWIESGLLTPDEAVQVLTELAIGSLLASIQQGIIEEVN